MIKNKTINKQKQKGEEVARQCCKHTFSQLKYTTSFITRTEIRRKVLFSPVVHPCLTGT